MSADQGCSKVGNDQLDETDKLLIACPPIRVVPRLETWNGASWGSESVMCPPIRVVPRLETIRDGSEKRIPLACPPIRVVPRLETS